MVRQSLKSDTIKFNLFMAAIESVHGSMQLMAPLMTPDQFVITSIVIGIVHSMGGVYLRFLTTEALEDK